MSVSLGDAILYLKGDNSDARRKLSETEGEARGFAGRVSSMLQSAFSFAGGQLITSGLNSILGGLQNLAGEALNVVSNNERMRASLTALMTKEIERSGIVTKQIAVGKSTVQLTKEQSAHASDLALKIKEASLRYEDMKRSQQYWPKDPIKAGLNQVELEQRAAALSKLQSEYSKLTGSVGKSVTVYQTETTSTISRADAMKKAADAAKELEKWVGRTAIESPFEKKDVVSAFRSFMTGGFTSDEAKRQTTAILDFGAATGATGEVLDHVAVAYGQIRRAGKLMGQDMMQLTNAGIDVTDALVRSGKVAGLTTENFRDYMEKGLIPSKIALDAITESIEKDFGGSGKAQAGLFSGLIASLSDLKEAAIEDVFTPIFKKAQPYLEKFVNLLQDPATKAAMQAMGNAIGDVFGKIMTGAEKLFTAAQSGGAGGVLEALGLTPEAVASVQSTVNSVLGFIMMLVNWLVANIPVAASVFGQVATDLAPVATAIIGVLGMAWTWLSTNMPAILATIKKLLGDLWTRLEPIIKEIANWLATQIPIAAQTFAKFFNETLLPALKDVFNFIDEKAIPFITTLWEWLKTNIPQAVDEVVKVFNTLLGIQKDVSDAISNFIKERLQALLDAFNKVKDVVEKVVNFIKQFKDGIAGIDPSKILGGGSGSGNAPGTGNPGGNAGVQSVGGMAGAAFAAAAAQTGPRVAQLIIKGKVLAEAVFEDGADAARVSRRRSYAS